MFATGRGLHSATRQEVRKFLYVSYSNNDGELTWPVPVVACGIYLGLNSPNGFVVGTQFLVQGLLLVLDLAHVLPQVLNPWTDLRLPCLVGRCGLNPLDIPLLYSITQRRWFLQHWFTWPSYNQLKSVGVNKGSPYWHQFVNLVSNVHKNWKGLIMWKLVVQVSFPYLLPTPSYDHWCQ